MKLLKIGKILVRLHIFSYNIRHVLLEVMRCLSAMYLESDNFRFKKTLNISKMENFGEKKVPATQILPFKKILFSKNSLESDARLTIIFNRVRTIL